MTDEEVKAPTLWRVQSVSDDGKPDREIDTKIYALNAEDAAERAVREDWESDMGIDIPGCTRVHVSSGGVSRSFDVTGEATVEWIAWETTP